MEKEMANHSSVLAWRIPWMEEPCGLQSTGSQRVRHDWVTNNNNLLETSLAVQWLRLCASKAGRCGFDLRSGIFPAISANKDVIIISDWSPPMRTNEPWGNTGMKKKTCHLVTINLQLLPKVNPKETQDVKIQELVPDNWDLYIKGMISVSLNSGIFPYTEKR